MKQSRVHHVLFYLGVSVVPLLGAAASTQWLAARVNYHPRLGEPLTTTPFPFYPPWEWFGWAAAAFPDDIALVGLTGLPLLVAVLVAAVSLHRKRRAPSRTPPEATTPQTSPDRAPEATKSAPVTDRTLALTLSDADVEVFPVSAPKTQVLELEDLEEVFPASEAPPVSITDEPSQARVADNTARADTPSYGLLRQLSALEHTDAATSDDSPRQLRVDRLDSEVAHDAPTAEAPAPSLEHADTVEAPTPRNPTARLQVDPVRPDRAHAVAPTEAPRPEHRDTGRLSEVPTVEAEALAAPLNRDDVPPALTDPELFEESVSQLDDVDFDETSPEDMAAALASLDVGSDTQKLGAVESAALAQFAQQVASSAQPTSSAGADRTAERPAASPDEDADVADEPNPDNAKIDEEEWVL